ncbi:MAG: XrtA/PEP-CTERM system histidine kinase PrsK [Chthoniobacteraceae bacterium]
MTHFNVWLAGAAALFAVLLALAAIIRPRRTVAGWFFAIGMLVIGGECVLQWRTLLAGTVEGIWFWATMVLVAKAFSPAAWIAFSLTYSRGNYREFLWQHRWLLAGSFVVPPLVAILGFRGLLTIQEIVPQSGELILRFGTPGTVLNLLLLVSIVVILVNLERTFRSAVGMMRWRIKFLLLGLAVIFGARIFTRSQSLLFGGQELALMDVETSAVIIGCLLIGISHARQGFAEVDLYPSRAVLQSSITVFLIGGYLFIVGLFGQWVARYGGGQYFRLQTLLVLLAVAALGVALLSDRAREKMRDFVSRNFRRPEHDFRHVWTELTQRLSSASTVTTACGTTATLLSEVFHTLSVTIWIGEAGADEMTVAGTTKLSRPETEDENLTRFPFDAAFEAAVVQKVYPFNLEKIEEPWAEVIRQASQAQFGHGGDRVAAPLVAGNRLVGLIVLGDRVLYVPFTVEELDLIKCMADQLAATLLNIRLNSSLMAARELEAFQTMSAFFVHDLKNSAASLNLMLKNLPVHFDDPEFREDAFRAIGKAVGRINHLIERLSAFRNKIEIRPVTMDLNQLVEEVLEGMGPRPGIEFARNPGVIPLLRIDPEQMRSVLTNLLVNAAEAMSTGGGRIEIVTSASNDSAIIGITDSGGGMSPEFLLKSLFRPFQSSKKNGLGIGMFQSKMIVEAHSGKILVDSELGKGTSFRIFLPLVLES